MPQRNSWSRRLLLGRRAWDEWDEREDGAKAASQPAPPRRRRTAMALTFAVLFCAGASLSAIAGNGMQSLLADGSTTDTATTDTTTTPAEPAPSPDPTPAPSPEPTPAPSPEPTPAPTPAPSTDPTPPSVPVTPGSGSDSGYPDHSDSSATFKTVRPVGPSRTSKARVRSAHPSIRGIRAGLRGRDRLQATRHARRHSHAHRVAARPHPVELEGAASATVWLNRALPDPTPPALRLNPHFASRLYRVSKRAGADWALVLGVLRADGRLGSAPAGPQLLARTATRLGRLGGRNSSRLWAAAFAYSGGTAFADRATALAHYYRAVGLRALVRGLMAERKEIARRVLSDRRVSIYSAGHGDISSGRVNVRVNAMIEYLADTFGQVTVSCLISGHRLYARPGVISAHIYGLAADISSVGGTPILGHQQPGGITEQAVRALLQLPPEMMPRQVISLLGLGGPSFPLANHYNHIHVGY
jgi:hypothetical protein